MVYLDDGILFGYKKNKVLIHATTFVDLENILLSEISQSQKTHITWFYLYEKSRIGKSIETGSRRVVSLGWGEWGGMMGDS